MRTTALLLFSAILLVGCGANDAIKATKGMPERMDRMSGQLDRTEQALGRVFSFEALLKEQYGKVLLPVPFDLIPFAREFAKYAPAQELVEVTYLWVRKINETTLELPNPTPEEIFQFDWRKMHVQAALQAVAGEIPRRKLDVIVYDQIIKSGRHAEDALNLLMLRTRYFRDVMLDGSVLSGRLDNVGKLEEAIKYAEEIEYIARLRFSPMIGLQLIGFKDNDMDVQEKFDPALALKTWQKIKTKADAALKVNVLDLSPVPGENEALYQAKLAQFNKAMGTIQARIRGWGGQP